MAFNPLQHPRLGPVCRFAASTGGVVLVIWMLAWLMAPATQTSVPAADEAELARVDALQRTDRPGQSARADQRGGGPGDRREPPADHAGRQW